MDKAELVFQKYAGVFSKIFKVFKKTTKLPGYKGVVTHTTPNLAKIEKVVGKAETGTAQRMRETMYKGMVNTQGKVGISKAWTAEDKVKGLAKEKMFKQLGLT